MSICGGCIFWRILDWGCGLNPDVRCWLDKYARGSMTYALRSGDGDYLECIYAGQMQGEGVRRVTAAAPAITMDLDYAERLFGFNSADELVKMVSFLCSKISAGESRMDDDIYFLCRAVSDMLVYWSAGADLLEPFVPVIEGLKGCVESLRDDPAYAEESEYICFKGDDSFHLSRAAEAALGYESILNVLSSEDMAAGYYVYLWGVYFLDKTYYELYNTKLI